VIAGFAGRPADSVCLLLLHRSRTGGNGSFPDRSRRRRRLADYVTVATPAFPPRGNDSEERLEKAEGLAAAVRLYAEVFEVDPGGDPEVVHRFARSSSLWRSSNSPAFAPSGGSSASVAW
jgi:hypothetical protein